MDTIKWPAIDKSFFWMFILVGGCQSVDHPHVEEAMTNRNRILTPATENSIWHRKTAQEEKPRRRDRSRHVQREENVVSNRYLMVFSFFCLMILGFLQKITYHGCVGSAAGKSTSVGSGGMSWVSGSTCLSTKCICIHMNYNMYIRKLCTRFFCK